jgi:hypothetical protein
MEAEEKQQPKNKGGRPRLLIKRDQLLTFSCTLIERKLIANKAQESNSSISEYLRELAINGRAGRKNKSIPKEVLLFTGTLNHLAANLNLVAKKRNQMDELNEIERAGLNELSMKIKQLAMDIRNYLV